MNTTSATRRGWLITALFLCGSLAVVAVLAPMAEAAVSFKGKKITFICGCSQAGGTNRVMRLLGAALQKHLPGKPTIIYQNMRGGGGTKGANYFATRVKPDGLTILATHSDMLQPRLLGSGKVKFDPSKFAVIGSINRGGSINIIRNAVKSRLKDHSKKPLVVGAVSGDRVTNAPLVWGAEYLGWNLRFIVGYPGTQELALAMRRGEIDIMGTANMFVLKQLLDEGIADPLVQPGIPAGGKYRRRSSFPNTPTVAELLDAKGVKGQPRKAYLAWTGSADSDKWYTLPAGTPKDIVTTHRKAFDKAVLDPDFIANMKKQVSKDSFAISGPNLEILIAQIVNTSDQDIAFMEKLQKKYKLVSTGKALPRTVKAILDDVRKGGRKLLFNVKGASHWARVSSSKSKVQINGKATKRSKLKKGMKCKITYKGSGTVATLIRCK